MSCLCKYISRYIIYIHVFMTRCCFAYFVRFETGRWRKENKFNVKDGVHIALCVSLFLNLIQWKSIILIESYLDVCWLLLGKLNCHFFESNTGYYVYLVSSLSQGHLNRFCGLDSARWKIVSFPFGFILALSSVIHRFILSLA